MGQGGRLIIRNCTPYRWTTKKDSRYTYQMNNFDLPDSMEANSWVSVYVEYSEAVFKNHEDDEGKITYEVQTGGSGSLPSFEIYFQWPGNHNPAVFVNIFFQTGLPFMGPGYRMDVGGWQHDGEMFVTLMGNVQRGLVFATGMTYMQAFIAQGWGKRTLRQLCIIGSHDAGMYTINGGTAGANASNTKTQILNLDGQLQCGARYFDLRPVITAGKYAAGHYSYVGGTLESQGCNGGYMTDMVNDINRFTANCPELVILKFSHSANTDVGRDYKDFSTAEWNGLYNVLKGLNFLVKRPSGSDFTKETLESFIGNKKAAVIVLIDGGNAKCDPSQGFFNYNECFPVYDSYADTNDVNDMISNQVKKFNENHEYFLFSWTMTQSGWQSVMGPSILSLAKDANKKFKDIFKYISGTHIPNIFYADRITIGTGEYPLLYDVVIDLNSRYTGASAVKQVVNLSDVEEPNEEEWSSPPATSSPLRLAVRVLWLIGALLAASVAVLHFLPEASHVGSPGFAAMLALFTVPVAIVGGLLAYRQHRRGPRYERLPPWCAATPAPPVMSLSKLAA